MSALLPAMILGAALASPAQAVPGPREQDPRELRVWAAASLGGVLQADQEGWLAAGGAPLALSLDASSRLAMQVAQGAPADVIITADRSWMDWLVGEGAVSRADTRLLAVNRLVVVVPADGAVLGPEPGADLAGWLTGLPKESRIGVAGEEVPAGRRARETLAGLGILGRLEGQLVTGASVRSVLEWVARGELPLGFVYRSDARGDGRVRVVASVPDSLHVPIEIFGGAVGTSRHREEALRYLDRMVAEEGQAAFREAGFLPAPAGPPAGDWGPASGAIPVSIRSAIQISVQVALVATLLTVIPAVGMGWLLARRPFPGKSILSALLLTPLVVPPVVTGFLLLSVLGNGSPVGRGLADLGVALPFTFMAAVTAAGVVGFPLFVISVRNAFEAVDFRLEEMSWTLGSRPRRTFWRVSLPLAIPGIGAGAVLAFARALGEFGATVVLAGNVEGETRTIALAVYTLLEAPQGRGAVWILVGASVAISLMALAGFEYLSRRQRRLVRRDPDA